MGKRKGKDKPPTTIRDVNIDGGDFIGRDKITNINLPPQPELKLTPHQLDDPPADFVGRAAELDELCAAVQTQGALICGLTGLGGVGKTALGLVLAHRLKDQYPNGQIFLKLLGASGAPLSTAVALERLIHTFEPDRPLPDDLEELRKIYLSILYNRRILVFLDDARDAAQVRALLPPRPALAIVTSRKRFDLSGYHTRDVSALPLDDAVKLICAVWGQTADVTALAHRCGCLPMALRAAGALLKRRPDLTPPDVDKLLTDAARRLALVDPERETTVDAAFQISYDQLTPELQARWRALGVFPADFDTPAAAAVWENAADPGETLADLHAAGLVDAVTGGRWRLHDLARDFTRALCEPAETDALAYRHAAYYLNVLYACRDLYMKGNENILAGLALFDRERANIEAGQAWAAAQPADPAAARLCNAYPDVGFIVLDLRLHPRTQIAWREAALTAARALGKRDYEGAHLGSLGNRFSELGEQRRAIEYQEQALIIIREIGDKRNEGTILNSLGLDWAALGEPRRAIEYHEQALVIAREIGDRRGEGNALGSLGNAYLSLGEPRRAIDYYEQHLVITRQIGDRRGEGNALGNLGNAYLSLGEPRRAIDYYEQVLVIMREIGDRRSEGCALGNLGGAWADLGESHRAIEYYEQALVIDREIGDRRGEGCALGNLGLAWADLGAPRRAIEYHEQALVIDREIGDRRGEGQTLNNLGSAYQNLDQLEQAAGYYEEAIALDQNLPSLYNNLAGVYFAQGNLERAFQYYQRCEELEPETALSACVKLGLIACCQGNDSLATEWFQKALALYAPPRGSVYLSRAGALENQAQALLCLGQRAEALAAIQAAVDARLLGDTIDLDDYFLLRSAPHPPDGLEEIIAILQAAKDAPPPTA